MWENCAGRVAVVFDGYLEKTTKDHAHKKRYSVASMDIVLSIESELQCEKDVYLSNPINKQNFINLLSQYLWKKGISIEQCTKDADLSIVRCAMKKAMKKDTIIIADDTDILVLAVHYLEELNPPKNIYMFRPSSNTYVDLKSVQNNIPKPVRSQILSIHAISGCDTVSQLYGIGKDKLFKQLCKNPDKTSQLLAFSRIPYDEKSIKDGGLKTITQLYNINKAQYHDIRPLWVWSLLYFMTGN